MRLPDSHGTLSSASRQGPRSHRKFRSSSHTSMPGLIASTKIFAALPWKRSKKLGRVSRASLALSVAYTNVGGRQAVLIALIGRRVCRFDVACKQLGVEERKDA